LTDIDSIDIIDCMASITIRDLEPEVKEQLRVRAARHGRSMEEEARVILRAGVAEQALAPVKLGDAICRRFQAFGVELELPAREPIRSPPRFR
jgi:plasmid stability protein